MSKLDKIARDKGVDVAKQKWISSSLIYYQNNRSDLGDFIKTMMNDHSGAIWKDPMRGNYPVVKDIDDIDRIVSPVLIIVGEEDKLFLPLAKKLHSLIKSSKLNVFPSTGHLVNLESPNMFNKAIESFIETIS
jgi:pimeloyl-ACP methyl ester carboxylesterase